MKIQEQVCTKPQAIRLKELGVVQKSVFYYHNKFEWPVIGDSPIDFRDILGKQVCNDKKNAASAYSVAELGVALPTLGISTIKSSGGTKGDFYWCQCHYFNKHETRSNNEAEARAEMLIWILEQKHNACTIEEVNKRLTQ